MFKFHIVQREQLPEMHCAVTSLEGRRHWSLEERLRRWDEELELMSFLQERILCHVPPPVQLGMRRGSLAHKFQAVMHILFLLSGSVDGCTQLLQSIPAWVSDYGTEIAVARVQRAPVSEVFPFIDVGQGLLHRPARLVEEVDFSAATSEVDFNVSAGICPTHADFNASTALEVPGVLHILHNAGRHLEDHLVSFAEAVARMSALTRLLSRKETKQRLFECLFEGSAAATVLWKPFQKWHHECHLERWGTVATCLTELDDDMLYTLRHVWDLNRLLGHQACL